MDFLSQTIVTQVQNEAQYSYSGYSTNDLATLCTFLRSITVSTLS